MGIMVYQPRRFVAQWLRFHKLNVITIKQLFYLHKEARRRSARLPSTRRETEA
jgi:hypothetical protein